MEEDGVADDNQAAPQAELPDELPESGVRSAHARPSRKRTKTGCLTCRKRRIKCGEERPTCGNCIKSKRQCEGYNQRVIFKDPLSTYPISSSSTQTNTPFHARVVPGVSSASQQSHFHHVHNIPQTSPLSFAGNRSASSESQPLAAFTSSVAFPVQYHEPRDQAAYDILPTGDKCYKGIFSEISESTVPIDTHYDTREISHLPQGAGILNQQIPNKTGAHYDFNSLHTQGSKPGTTQSSNGTSCASEPPLQELVYHSDIREAASALLTHSYQGSANWPAYFSQHNSPTPKISSRLYSESTPITPDHGLPPRSENILWEDAKKAGKLSRDIAPQEQGQHAESQAWVMEEKVPSITIQYQDHIPSDTKNVGVVVGIRLDDQNTETYPSEDNLFDKSDDEMGLEESDQDTEINIGKAQDDHLRNNDLGIVVALQASQDMHEQRLRTYHSFLDSPNVLTSYQPSARSSPLNDSTAARIFYHYVNVTAPSISLYERHPANPSLMFQGRPIPRSQQHIWAYTMPTLALNNQALLHAMLAIGSLHIALLQDGPKTPALKHYHIAIRRVAKCVRLPMRRGQPAVLAATLLLGWYELMSGEHQKWSSHLLGATHLLKEIDFAGITKFLKSRKLQQRQARYSNLYHHEMALGRFESHPDERADISEIPKYDDVNEDLVGMIIGKKLRYDEYGQVLEDFDASSNQHRVYTRRELETYETQRDLFWWYCKQDAFQSILSGNRLFMQYDCWSHCPPRAAIGKRDATYGTFDHLILLLGRLAEFAAKDLKRKRKAIQASGGKWRPPVGAPVQLGPMGQNAPHQSGPSQVPSFAGMMPGAEGKTKLPRGFSPVREDSPTSEDDSRSLEEWTAEAEEEWQEIRNAFGILEENFGLDFQPLGSEHCQPIDSPFGPALQYRTYSIAGIWIIYYMGLILCHRYHPTMPPAATTAAGLVARQTGFYANEIGRISAAIAPHASQVTQVSTGVGAGLIECTFGLFIAGVQYQIPAQRSWLVQRCFDIVRLTGWQIAEAIAMGCESAWTKTADLGIGPPYTRVTEKKIDQEVWYSARKGTNPYSSRGRDGGKIFIARTDRVHYALGLLGVEQSLENFDFDDDDADDEERLVE